MPNAHFPRGKSPWWIFRKSERYTTPTRPQLNRIPASQLKSISTSGKNRNFPCGGKIFPTHCVRKIVAHNPLCFFSLSSALKIFCALQRFPLTLLPHRDAKIIMNFPSVSKGGIAFLRRINIHQHYKSTLIKMLHFFLLLFFEALKGSSRFSLGRYLFEPCKWFCEDALCCNIVYYVLKRFMLLFFLLLCIFEHLSACFFPDSIFI